MELTEDQHKHVAPVLPMQRGNVRVSNLHGLNAILYVAEQGYTWRGFRSRFGRWHTLDTRMNRWSKNGGITRVFAHLQKDQLVRIKPEAVSPDRTIVKGHPDATGARKQTGPRPLARPAGVGPPRCIWLPRRLERR